MSWFTHNNTKKEEESNSSLSDVVRGIQHAVNTAVESTEKHYITTMQKFFDKKDGEEVYKPKMIEMEVAEGQTMKIPLISLMAQNGLMLEEMKVNMTIQVKSTEVKTNNNINRTSFSVVAAPNEHKITKGNMVQVEMKFKAGDSPEGVERIAETLTNLIETKVK
jgi:hypothetical protein